MSVLFEPISARRRGHPAAAAPRADRPESPSSDVPTVVRRGLILIAALTLLLPINAAWTEIIGFPMAAFASVVLLTGAFVLIALTCCARNAASLATAERWLLVLAVLTLVVWAAAQAWGVISYGTDEGALQQGAAQALLHGHDPYGANLSDALYAWTSSSRWYTFLLNGNVVNTYGYPSLPVLLVAPFVALTHGGQGVSIAYVFVVIGLMVATFAALPEPLKPLSIVVCMGVTPLVSGAVAGETEVLAMVPLVLVAATWTRVGHDARLGRLGASCAACLGIAVCANQTAWFFVPFVVAGIAMIVAGRLSARAASLLVLRFCAVVLLVAFVLNLPFIIWSPGAWATGILAPLTQHAEPIGQGVVSFAGFGTIGGGDLRMFGFAAASAFVVLLALFVLYFRQLARVAFLLPLLPLFLSDRALAGYWLFAVPVILVGAVRVDDRAVALALAPAQRAVQRLNPRILVGAAAVAPLACLAVAFAAPSPMRIQVDGGLSATAGTQTRLTLTVRNASGWTLTPTFYLGVGDRPSAMWTRLSGPARLEPHETAKYVIRASEADLATPAGEPYSVIALTDNPQTISSSATIGNAIDATTW